jgi:hypothetical protein
MVFCNSSILKPLYQLLIDEQHIFSYKHGFKGFAAKLTDEQTYQISRQ